MASPWVVLALLAAAMLAVVFWHRNLGYRELANRVAKETCARSDAQLLDGTVAFARFTMGRDVQKRWALRRTYVFDYTHNGNDRLQGFVVLRGFHLEAVGLAPELIH
jgi:hypothetical protein